MDLFKPRGAASPRKPTDNNQKNGQVINTPRYSEFGGLSSAPKAGYKNIYYPEADLILRKWLEIYRALQQTNFNIFKASIQPVEIP